MINKELLSEKEAAYFACVSLSQFRKRAKEYGILPVPFMGKRVYAKSDIMAAYEKVRDSISRHYPLNVPGKGARNLRSSEKKRDRLESEPSEAGRQP